MEDVSAAELGTGLSTQLLSETNRTELVLMDVIEESIVLGTCLVQAWQALALILDTLACMATVERLSAYRDLWLFFVHLSVASVDQD